MWSWICWAKYKEQNLSLDFLEVDFHFPLHTSDLIPDVCLGSDVCFGVIWCKTLVFVLAEGNLNICFNAASTVSLCHWNISWLQITCNPTEAHLSADMLLGTPLPLHINFQIHLEIIRSEAFISQVFPPALIRLVVMWEATSFLFQHQPGVLALHSSHRK